MAHTFISSLFDSVLSLIGQNPITSCAVIATLIGLRVLRAWKRFEKSARIR